MTRHLNNECVDTVYCYGLAEGNGNAASQMYRKKYQNLQHPSPKVIWDTFSRLKELVCFYATTIEKPLRSIEDEEQILELIQENLRVSVREISREAGIPPTTVLRILNSNGMYPYHLTLIATILLGDLERRLNFCQWLIEVEHIHPRN